MQYLLRGHLQIEWRNDPLKSKQHKECRGGGVLHLIVSRAQPLLDATLQVHDQQRDVKPSSVPLLQHGRGLYHQALLHLQPPRKHLCRIAHATSLYRTKRTPLYADSTRTVQYKEDDGYSRKWGVERQRVDLTEPLNVIVSYLTAAGADCRT
jgi:hypothetical protein